MIKMSNPLISVIIPIYNVEKYLRRCLETVISQSYLNLEIILVNDGSTDTSGNICEEYAEEDSRIKIIHKENGGLSSARNAGMKIANGDYIAFLDSDDFIHPKMYEVMLETLINTDSDMVISGICMIDDDDTESLLFPLQCDFSKDYVVIEKDQILHQMVERDVVTVVQWNKLFKRAILVELEYPEGKYHEDVYVIHQQLFRCNRITYLEAELYYYVQRCGSIMHVESKKRLEDSIGGYLERISFMKEKGQQEAYDEAVSTLLLHILWKFKTIALMEGYSNLCKWLGEQFQQIAENFPETIPRNGDYMLLKSNPAKYCRRLRKLSRKEKRRINCYHLYKKFLKR